MIKVNHHYIENFYKAILTLQTEEECKAFFDDICTINELLEISRRLEVAKLLSEGKVFSDINKESGASSATISRVNKCVMYGNGGYQMVIERLKKGEE